MNRLILAYMTASFCLASFVQANIEDDILDPSAKIRHSQYQQPLELNVEARATYNDKFMALMESPCRPESDGFFGATFGEPVMINYGFRLEAEPLSSIVQMLDILEDKVVDNVLSETFSQMCGFRRRQLIEGASGFRFFKFEEFEKCVPAGDASNFCGVYLGQVNVYGHGNKGITKDIIEMIQSALSPSDPTKLYPQMVDISFDNQFLQAAGGNDIEKKDQKSILGWIGLAVVSIMFMFTIWWFFIRGDKQGDTGAANQSKGNGSLWNNPSKESDPASYDLGGSSIGLHFESNVSPYRDSDEGLDPIGRRSEYLNHETSANTYKDDVEGDHTEII